MSKLGDAITSIRPGAQWIINGDTYAGLVWLDGVQVMPTALEVTNAQAALDAAAAAEVQRQSALNIDAGVITLLNQAKTSTVAQIDTWLTTNVTTLAQARSVLAAIIKVLAIQMD